MARRPVVRYSRSLGGPFAHHGDRVAAENQLYAAAGYVVVYINPRGSTSCGKEFGNLIHPNYPGRDYDNLMTGVDSVIERGYIDTDNLLVTGGSEGGALSSWIVGKTSRFQWRRLISGLEPEPGVRHFCDRTSPSRHYPHSLP